ncbi:MAG TPA: TetR family transcriptional regulator [Cytophagales bacterium]|nr:TetR family transcriptional regulator [Cytophagales bacterium]HAA22769.1 TetR family transcriptional regulator [Cytophagales bacterium]HAP62118.1 TetR family transcriptional regulator [Cytophagales bacterium]
MARQSIAEIRRREILTTYYEIAKKEGLERTSFAMIAAKLEMRPSLIVHYFKNRDELISSLIQFNLDQYEQIFNQEMDDLEGNSRKQLLSVIDRVFSKKWNDLFDDGVFYNCYSLSYRDSLVRAKFRELHQNIRSRLEALIKDCMNAGMLAISDEKLLAQHVSNLMDGAYYFAGMIDNKEEQEQFMQTSKEGALQLFHWLDEVLAN